MELVLQGFRRQVYKHTIKGSHTGHPFGVVAKDAVSVFPVGRHQLTLGGDFDGHFSVNMNDIKKILLDAASNVRIDELASAIADCLHAMSERAEEQPDLLTSREDALLVTATSLVSSLSARLQGRLADEGKDGAAA